MSPVSRPGAVGAAMERASGKSLRSSLRDRLLHGDDRRRVECAFRDNDAVTHRNCPASRHRAGAGADGTGRAGRTRQRQRDRPRWSASHGRWTVDRHAVVAADAGRPLSGARIGIRNGPTTQVDERGAFTLTGVPTGTRMLDVRAVSYAPVDLPVDVVDGGAPLRIEMASVKSVLDTVKVLANLSVNREYKGFLRRQKHGGAGRFITSEDIK